MSSPLAGQQSLNCIAKPSLVLTIPQSKPTSPLSGLLEVNLESPFAVHTPSSVFQPFALSPQQSAAPNTLTSIFFDWDDDETEPESAKDDDIVQYISILPGQPFYSPVKVSPTKSLSSPPFNRSSFACSALRREAKTPAQLFHSELERMAPVDTKTFLLDSECLEEMDMELFLTPVNVFSEDSMKKGASIELPPHWFNVSVPDVPTDLDSGDSGDEDDEDDFDEEDSDSFGDAIVVHAGHDAPLFKPSLDRRLVAPFEDPRCSVVVPSCLFA